MRALLASLAIAFLAPGPAAAQAPPAPGAFTPFEATWSARGQRQVLRLGARTATTVSLSGAFSVASGQGLSKGYRGEALGFDDGAGDARALLTLTDDKGDQIFADIKGETVASGRKWVGKITGGTGRYAGIEGDFSFAWQFVVQDEDGGFQGRAVDFRGRYRRGAAEAPGTRP